MASIHQVNHSGQEFNISYRSRLKNSQDYRFFDNSVNEGVRLWNRSKLNCNDNDHYKKFMQHPCKYIDSLVQKQEKKDILRFWGEYEGHSEFELLLNKSKYPAYNNPVALHRPFYCGKNINNQNTDPYIFGDSFYYAICGKNGLKNICNGDIILFGTEFGPEGNIEFHLDTLFVVKDIQPSILNSLYNKIYQESTLKRIGISNCTNGTIPIHTGKKFSDDSSIFSFFPAKLSKSIFGRPVIDTVWLGLKKTGSRRGSKSRQLESNENIASIWEEIAKEVIKQGFVLGTHANQLITKPKLAQ